MLSDVKEHLDKGQESVVVGKDSHLSLSASKGNFADSLTTEHDVSADSMLKKGQPSGRIAHSISLPEDLEIGATERRLQQESQQQDRVLGQTKQYHRRQASDPNGNGGGGGRKSSLTDGDRTEVVRSVATRRKRRSSTMTLDETTGIGRDGSIIAGTGAPSGVDTLLTEVTDTPDFQELSSKNIVGFLRPHFVDEKMEKLYLTERYKPQLLMVWENNSKKKYSTNLVVIVFSLFFLSLPSFGGNSRVRVTCPFSVTVDCPVHRVRTSRVVYRLHDQRQYANKSLR